MTRATFLAERGAVDGTVVVADYQAAGRGTHGRIWSAPPGTCLMFTVIGRPELEPPELSELPLRVGNAVATMLYDYAGVRCNVEPPNDVMVNGRKICGILCSSRVQGGEVEWVLCGIGLNTNMTTEQLPVDEATSVLIETGRCTGHSGLLEQLLSRLRFLRGDRSECR